MKRIANLLKNTKFTVFDVGARHGLLHLTALHPYIELHAFEPEPESLEQLKLLNKKVYKKKYWPLALLDRETTIDLQIFKTRGLTSTLTINEKQLASSIFKTKIKTSNEHQFHKIDTTKVQATTLNKYCIKKNLSWNDFLKLDVQGAELKVLEGAKEMITQNSIGAIKTEVALVTVYKNEPHFTDIDTFLVARGYYLHDLILPTAEMLKLNKFNFTNRLYEKHTTNYADAIYVLQEFKKDKVKSVGCIMATLGYLGKATQLLMQELPEAEVETIIKELTKKSTKQIVKEVLHLIMPPMLKNIIQ